MFHIVLVEPEIPQNAGNIARTCAATGTHLHFIRPLGFEVTDKYLKRAGLDYWNLVDISYYDSFDELYEKYKGARFFFFTTKGRSRHSDVRIDTHEDNIPMQRALLRAGFERCGIIHIATGDERVAFQKCK